MSKTDGIKDKLAALLKLARDKGATPAEAALAAEMAQKLADKYRVDLGSIALDDRSDVAHDVRAERANGAVWRRRIWFVVCRVNGVYGINDGNAMRMWGHPNDIEVVQYLAGYLEALLDEMSTRAHKEHLATETRYWKRVSAVSFKKAWCIGAMDAIEQRMADLKQTVERDSAATGYGLIKVDNLKAMARGDLAGEMQARGIMIKRGLRDGRYNSGVYNSGREAGAGIGINRAVANNQRLLG